MLTTIKVLAVGGPIVLALMGAFVTDRPPEGRSRIVWYVIFGFVGLITAGSAVLESMNVDEKLDQLTGGDSFCYLRAEIQGVKPTEPIPLTLVNYGGHSIAQAAWLGPKDAVRKVVDGKFVLEGIAVVSPCSIVTATMRDPIKLGSWRADITTRNRSVTEFLKLSEYKGQLVQSIEIYENGRRFHVETYPEGASE